MTRPEAWLLLGASGVVVLLHWAAMYYLSRQFPGRYGDQSDPPDGSVTE